VWVANYLSNDVTRIDAATGQVTGTTPVGESPEGIAADGSVAWVAVNTR
jgi:YVTN family beta-propeller protein